MGCCREYGCRRKLPILICRGPFSGRWYAVTTYAERGDLGAGNIVASQKHDITDVLIAALLAEGWTPPDKEDDAT